MEAFVAQKGLWNLVREKVLRERGALPEEECDVKREYKAMHEENFLSSWLREDGKEREKKEGWKWEGKQRRKKAKRGEEKGNKEENETGTVKRRCVGSVSVEAFEIFSQGGDLESCGDLSW